MGFMVFFSSADSLLVRLLPNRRSTAGKMNRRNFLVKFFLGGIVLAFLDAFWFEKYIIDWNEFDISNDSGRFGNSASSEIHSKSDSPKKYSKSGRSGTTIKLIHLSDLHIGSIKSFHESLAQRINEERPDALLITGDSVDRTRDIPVLDSFLAMVDTDVPKFAILGNVDYEGDVDFDKLRRTYEKHNGKLLVNQNHRLQVGNRFLNIVGVDDFLCGYPDFVLATEGLDMDRDTVVLNHCPAYRDEIDTLNAKLGRSIKLILSGHTHGGQITFFGKPIFTPYGSADYEKGWYKNEHSQLYVSRGIGTRVLPFRFGSRAEAIIFHV